MTLADRAVALLLPPALQGAPISATSPIAVLRWRCQLMTLRFMCCRPNPDRSLFMKSSSSPTPTLLANSHHSLELILDVPPLGNLPAPKEQGRASVLTSLVALVRLSCSSLFPDRPPLPKWHHLLKERGQCGGAGGGVSVF